MSSLIEWALLLEQLCAHIVSALHLLFPLIAVCFLGYWLRRGVLALERVTLNESEVNKTNLENKKRGEGDGQ
ncbi:MAG: hypothetical protein RLZ12_716 [Bacillota bacterium]|jgi:hypothetical protein